MARMMRAFFPQALLRASTEVPAAMDNIKEPPAAKPASAAASTFNTCGLIATTQTEDLPFTCDGAANREIFFACASLRSAGDGLGSTTWMDLTPLLSQPLSRAPPILPAPTSRIGSFVDLRAFGAGAIRPARFDGMLTASRPGHQAWPAHSSTAAATASSAVLPPQSTNWKAG